MMRAILKRSAFIFGYFIGDPVRIHTGAWKRSSNDSLCLFLPNGDLTDPPWNIGWIEAFPDLEGKLINRKEQS